MNILYDFQAFSLQRFGGISRYFYELIKHLERKPSIHPKLSVVLSNNDYLFADKTFGAKGFMCGCKFPGQVKMMDLINQYGTNRCLDSGDFDLFHPTYYSPYFLDAIDRKPFVLTIHDMIHELFQDQFFTHAHKEDYKLMLAQKATKIIAVSENTKNDIARIYNIDESKISVVYHGCSLKPQSKEIVQKIKFPAKYILFVGSRKGYKNFTFFVKSINRLLAADKELFVICGGGEPFSREELSLLETQKLSDRYLHVEITDQTLAVLYNKALAFIYPSLYEGFGIPILEAFSCQCPTILSNTSCFPEIAHDAAIYVDPCNSESIATTIGQVIYNQDLRKQLIQKGCARLTDFSWGKTADQTLAIYREILS